MLARTGKVEAGAQHRVESVPGVVEGENEFYFDANPNDDMLQRSCAVRVRIFRDGEAVADHSLWSEPGTKLATTFSLKVAPADDVGKADPHGHAD